MSPFKDRVIEIVRLVLYGKVVSYGQVALYAGLPRAAREVGWILQETGGIDLPWWRVINKQGHITIRGNVSADKNIQKKLLEAEGIEVSDDYQVSMEKYQFRASPELLKKLQLSNSYIQSIIEKGFSS